MIKGTGQMLKSAGDMYEGKVIASALLTVVLGCSSVYGSDAFDNMSTSEQAQTAGAYLEEIIKDIQNNYYGGNVTTDQLVQAAIKV